MTTHWPVKSTAPFGSTATAVLSMRSVKVPWDPVTSRTIWSCPLPTKLTEVSASVPESLIPPKADQVPVNGPTMTVLWMVTGTGVLAIAGVPAVPSDNSTDARHASMNDTRRMAPLFSLSRTVQGCPASNRHRGARAERAGLVRAAIPGSRNGVDPLTSVVTTFSFRIEFRSSCAPARLGQDGQRHVQDAGGWAGEGELAARAGVGAGPAGDRVHDGGLGSGQEPLH